MRPLGLSIWQMTALRPMFEAGSRLFVDVTDALLADASRIVLVSGMTRHDPLLGDALRAVLASGFLGPGMDVDVDGVAPTGGALGGTPSAIEADPAIVRDLMARERAAVAAASEQLAVTAGPERMACIRTDLDRLKEQLTDPVSHQAVMASLEAATWLNHHLHEWLGEREAADTLAQSVDHNITSQMGLALLDVADAVRDHPEVIAHLRSARDATFVESLSRVDGGEEARRALVEYLNRFGMRCQGEIDITRTRWSEDPRLLVPLILANVERFRPGESARRFERGRIEAAAAAEEVLGRLRQQKGAERADEVERMIGRLRTFAGYREHPKYGMVRRYLLYKRAILAEAGQLVADGALAERDDVFFLRFEEVEVAVATRHVDEELIAQRRRLFDAHQHLPAPRVLTSDGAGFGGHYHRPGLPERSLPGLGVSTGIVEGRARVILDMASADVEPGDILVTAHTDPSWSPLFVAISALVTEVGGLQTHGAVVAREYGLPAVVGVERATGLIRDGDTIRVDGTAGLVTILGQS